MSDSGDIRTKGFIFDSVLRGRVGNLLSYDDKFFDAYLFKLSIYFSVKTLLPKVYERKKMQ